MTNMSGVIQQLKKERVRLEDQLHRVTAALTAFGRVYMNGTGTKALAGRKKGTAVMAVHSFLVRCLFLLTQPSGSPQLTPSDAQLIV